MGVTIYETRGGWTLQVGLWKREFKRLIYAIQAAESLKVHIDNRKKLAI